MANEDVNVLAIRPSYAKIVNGQQKVLEFNSDIAPNFKKNKAYYAYYPEDGRLYHLWEWNYSPKDKTVTLTIGNSFVFSPKEEIIFKDGRNFCYLPLKFFNALQIIAGYVYSNLVIRSNVMMAKKLTDINLSDFLGGNKSTKESKDFKSEKETEESRKDINLHITDENELVSNLESAQTEMEKVDLSQPVADQLSIQADELLTINEEDLVIPEELKVENIDFVDKFVEVVSEQFAYQLEDEATARLVSRVRNKELIRNFVKTYDELYAATLHVLQKVELRIPYHNYYDDYGILRTEYVDFTEDRHFSNRQLVMGLIYFVCKYGPNSYLMDRLKQQNNILTDRMDNLLQQVDKANSFVKEKEQELKELETLKFIKQHYDKYTSITSDESLFILYNKKDKVWYTEKTDTYTCDTLKLAIKFDSNEEATDFINEIIKERKRAKKKGRKYKGVKNPKRFEVYQIAMRKV